MKKMLMMATTAAMIEQFNKNNILILLDMGYEVHVAGNFEKGNPISQERLEAFKKWLEERKCKWFNIPSTRKPTDYNNIRAYKQVVSLIKQYNYNFIHCHTPIGSVIARCAAHKTHTPIIYTAHGFHFYKGAPIKNWLIYYPVEKFFSRWTDLLILITKEDYERAKSFKAGKVVYVPGVGIDLDEFNKEKNNKGDCSNEARESQVDLSKEHGIRSEFGIPTDAKLLLSVGEVNKNKNHKLGIEALARLKDKNVYYVICGRGNMMDAYKILTQKLGISDRVIFAGYRTDVIKFYNEADVFLFPSLREGLSVAVMEAMAMGVPVICNDIRGNIDLIEDKVSGLLINNQIDELVKAIQELISNDELRDKIICEGRKKVKHFGIKNVSNMMRKVYEQGLLHKSDALIDI